MTNHLATAQRVVTAWSLASTNLGPTRQMLVYGLALASH